VNRSDNLPDIRREMFEKELTSTVGLLVRRQAKKDMQARTHASLH